MMLKRNAADLKEDTASWEETVAYLLFQLTYAWLFLR